MSQVMEEKKTGYSAEVSVSQVLPGLPNGEGGQTNSTGVKELSPKHR